MKKYFTTIEYKKKNLKRAKKSLRRKLVSKEKRIALHRYFSGYIGRKKIKLPKRDYVDKIKPILFAPSDFRLIENTQECLIFFRDIRSEERTSHLRNSRQVKISLSNVTQIDYGTISILTAISDDLKYKKVNLQGDFPLDVQCRQFIIDSGFLNHMINEKNKPFPKTDKSDLIFFEEGCGKLSYEDNVKISTLIKNVVNHLTGVEEKCAQLKTILLEICGNSIEWSGTDNRQWLLGVKYEEDNVVFTVTDVGKGILEHLYRKFTRRFFDVFKSSDEILKGAFAQKYGSTTKEVNRNRGLPSIKAAFEDGLILNLKVLTNNVILQFDNESNSTTFAKGSSRFKGTFYQWEMNRKCINKLK